MSVDYLFTWMMVLLRSVGLIMQLPVVAGRPIPIPVRVALLKPGLLTVSS